MKLTPKEVKMIATLKKGEFAYIERGKEFVYVEKNSKGKLSKANIGKLLN